MKTKSRQALIYLIMLLILFADALIWLFKSWFSGSANLGYFLFAFGGTYLIYTELKLKRKNPLGIGSNGLNGPGILKLLLISLLLVLELANLYFFQFSVLSALLMFVITGLILYPGISSHAGLGKSSFLKICALFLLSIPSSFYLNSLFGLYIRKIYAVFIYSIIWLFPAQTILDETFIKTGDNFINIDTGCSGILTMYHILGLGIFLSCLFKVKLKRSIFLILLAWAVYIVLNLAQLTVLTYLNNIQGMGNVQSMHSFFANIISASGLVVVFVLFIIANAKYKDKRAVSIEAGEGKNHKTKMIYLLLILVLFAVAKLIMIFTQKLDNPKQVYPESNACSFQNYYSIEPDEKILSVLRDAKVSEYIYLRNDTGDIILIARTDYIRMLADTAKFETAREKEVEAIRTVPVNESLKVRKIINSDKSESYYFYTFHMSGQMEPVYEYKLEFRLLDMLNKYNDGVFYYHSGRLSEGLLENRIRELIECRHAI